MAARAANLAGEVRRPADMHLAEVPGVARQAATLGCARRECWKPDDLLLVGADGVEKPRAVTSLAPGALRRLVPQSDGNEMRVATEPTRDLRVTALADLPADKLLARVPLNLPEGGDRKQWRERQKQRACTESPHSTGLPGKSIALRACSDSPLPDASIVAGEGFLHLRAAGCLTPFCLVTAWRVPSEMMAHGPALGRDSQNKVVKKCNLVGPAGPAIIRSGQAEIGNRKEA